MSSYIHLYISKFVDTYKQLQKNIEERDVNKLMSKKALITKYK